MKKKVLIIDDEDQTDEISNLSRIAKGRGLILEFDQFNVGSSFLEEVLTDNEIDPKKVSSVFQEKYLRKRYHLICFDYELGPEEINGVDLLLELKSLAQRSQFLFYSSKLDIIVRKLLDEYAERPDNFEKIKKRLIALISARVEGFVDRKDFPNKIIEIFSKYHETLDDLFAEKMSEYPNYRTEYFEGMMIYDLEHLLQNNDGMSMKYKREIIEHLVAYLIRLHDDE